MSALLEGRTAIVTGAGGGVGLAVARRFAEEGATLLVPARYFVKALQTQFQAGDLPAILLPNLVFLLLSALFWLGLTAWKTRRRLDG